MKSLLLALVLLAGACAHAPAALDPIIGPGLPGNLHCFEHEHRDGTGRCVGYRSAQPPPGEFPPDVGVVIKLNKPGLLVDGPHDQPPPGVEVWAHPWSPFGPVSHEQIQLAIADLETCIAAARAGGRACLVHCTHGVDRTGLLVAIWRVRQGVLASVAWAEWRAFPRSKTDGPFYDAFERESGFHVPEAER